MKRKKGIRQQLFGMIQMVVSGYTIKVVSFGTLLINNRTQKIQSFPTEAEALDFLLELEDESNESKAWRYHNG